MTNTALRYNETPFHPNDLGTLLATFRDTGYVVLRHVFERDSVDSFRAAVEAAVERDDGGRYALPDDSPLLLAPTYAPRLRQVLTGALSGVATPPHPALFEIAWLLKPDGETPGAGQWHKDRAHDVVRRTEYHYPEMVHIGMYFADMTREHGPTEVILGSHRDPGRSPFAPDAQPTPALIRKEDVFLWDQGLWHRSTPRTVAGMRIFALFGFYSVPIFDGVPYRMTPAQCRAWQHARDDDERILYGGLFSAVEEP